MIRRMLWPIALLGATQVQAQDYGDCTELALPRDQAVVVQQIQGKTPRQHFYKNRSDDKACPAATPACERKAYLVPGDAVLSSGSDGDFVCATFIAPNGKSTSGWLPAAVLGPGEAVVQNAAAFAGEWKKDASDSISIKALPDGQLEVSGYASFGGDDPERVERGAVNVGEIPPVKVRIDGPVIVFDPESGNIDPQQESQGSCVVWLQRIGPVLLARDNLNCGGMNVTFTGVYRR